MASKIKRVYLIFVGVLIFLFLGIFGLDYFIECKLKQIIIQAPENVEIQYEAIEVNSFSGSVNLVNPFISVYDKSTCKLNVQIEMEYLMVQCFSYWNYFINDKIRLDDILFVRPKITYNNNKKKKAQSYKDVFKKGLRHIINVGNIDIKDAHIEVYDFANDSLILKTENLNFRINAIELNPSNEKNPLTYNNFKITSNTIFCRLNNYENLMLAHLDMSSDYSIFKGIKLKTKYSKETLSKVIKLERDHFDLIIDSIEINKQEFGFEQDSVFYFKSDRVDLHQPNFKLYRDKLVADKLDYKPLYSKVLRELNFDIILNSVFINNASITYNEKVKKDSKGGKLLFTNLNAEIKNLDNTYESGKKLTSCKVKTVFMDNTPVNVLWEFDINNINDKFVFKAELGNLSAKSMNQFMEPNLNVQLEGEIERTYFTIHGNDLNGQIDLKMKYDEFDVLILKENGKEKNKLLSRVINIFVSKDSKGASENFRHGSSSEVKRAMNKSIFNFLWLNIRAGLLNAMTGNNVEKFDFILDKI